MSTLLRISKKLGKKTIILPILYMLLIFILSSIPGDDSTRFSSFFAQINPGLQNLMHIPLFAGLTTLWILALMNYQILWKRVLSYSFFISWSYGLFDEFHQIFVPGRYPSLLDIILNTFGILLTIEILHKYFKKEINAINEIHY